MADHATAQAEQGPDAAARLRAALRLIFEPNLADRLAATGDPADLRRVARLATRQYRLLQLRNALRGSGRAATPLSPRSWLSPRAALGLALLLGLDLDLVSLDRTLGAAPEQLARDLERARLAVEPDLPPGCGEQNLPLRAALPLPVPERMALVGHLRQCRACQRALDAREALDGQLRAAIEAEAARLAAAPGPATAHHDWRLQAGWPGVVLAGVLLGALLLLGAAVAVEHLARHGGATALAGATEARPAGWLIQLTRDDQLRALETAGGEVRGLGSLPDAAGPARPFVSPKGDLIAAVYANPDIQSIDFRRWDGSAVATHQLQVRSAAAGTNADYGAWSTSWLDDETFLIVEKPLYLLDETPEDYLTRTAGKTRLVAVGVDGSERQLFQGDFCAVYPSPDGTLVALASCADTSPAATFELRPVTAAGLGPPVARLADQLGSELVWAPDSSRCFFAGPRDTDATPTLEPTATPVLNAPPQAEPRGLRALDRDGRLRTLWETTAASLFPVTVSPDGGTLVFASVASYADTTELPGLATVHYQRLALDSGAVTPLVDLASWGDSANPLWSPDGRTLLLSTVRPFYLAPAQGVPGPTAPGSSNLVAELVAIDQDWAATPFATSLDLNASSTLAWLPEDALPRQSPTPLSGLAGSLVKANAPGLDAAQIDAGSSAAPSGRYLVLTDDSLTIPAVWSLDARSERRLPAEASELAWLPDGDGLIGVAPARDGQSGSRLTFFAPEYPAGSYPLDFQSFDPADLGLRSDAVYARPLVAPGNNLLSCFVVDPSRQRVTLWLAGWELPARPVLAWPAPAGTLAGLPPVAAWVDGRTLLVVRPDDWQGSLPRAATLLRVSLDASGTVDVSPLRRLSSHGGDHGLLLNELALSPDGRLVAYRLRHLTGDGIDGAGYDTLEVAPSADLSRTLELARGRTRATAAEGGLAWSPDGAWLAAGLDGRLQLLAADGSSTLLLTPADQEGGHPLWLGDTLWLSLAGEDGRHVWQVPIR